jgi:hypothetical protein
VVANLRASKHHTTTVRKEREQLGDRRNVGESSCNSGDGTGQMAQPLMFMMKNAIKEEVTATSDKRVRDAMRTSRDRLEQCRRDGGWMCPSRRKICNSSEVVYLNGILVPTVLYKTITISLKFQVFYLILKIVRFP